MKKISNFISIFIFFVTLYTPSISNSQTILKITDSSQMNLEKINTISSVVEEGGILIGTIVSWPHRTSYTPINKEKCTTSSSNTSLPRCKWLECDGATVDPILYPEYTATATKTPSILYSVPYGKTDGELSPMNPKFSYSSSTWKKTMPTPFKIEADVAVNEGKKEGTDDGLIGLKLGSKGVSGYSSTVNTFTLSKGWNTGPELINKSAINVIYYIRVAN